MSEADTADESSNTLASLLMFRVKGFLLSKDKFHSELNDSWRECSGHFSVADVLRTVAGSSGRRLIAAGEVDGAPLWMIEGVVGLQSKL